MGCNMTEDIEKRIDRCVEKYQNLVKSRQMFYKKNKPYIQVRILA